ncbi:MAG: DUF4346 domain-containing protein [Candidatus Woesearchaeota archaeon]|nr:MAG: DUF4346 domain-containing protein [Candidatus Woesearchaeota archaeon]
MLYPKSTLSKDSETVECNYDEIKDYKYDPKGYFLIRINKEKKQLEAAYCRQDNKVLKVFTGKKPQDIYYAVCKLGLVSHYDHAAYLGKELEKAFLALKYNLDYIQDEELKL